MFIWRISPIRILRRCRRRASRTAVASACSAFSTGSASGAASTAPMCWRQLIADLQRAQPDHIAVTGDLINLSLPDGIRAGARLARSARLAARRHAGAGQSRRLCARAADLAPAALGRLHARRLTARRFPVRAPARTGGADRACRPSVPTLAVRGDRPARHGEQLARLGDILADACGARRLFRVVLIHHPPTASAQPLPPPARRRGSCARCCASTAPSWCCTATTTRIRWSGSTGRRPHSRRSACRRRRSRRTASDDPAGYNLYGIDGAPGRLALQHGQLRIARRRRRLRRNRTAAGCSDEGCDAAPRRSRRGEQAAATPSTRPKTNAPTIRRRCGACAAHVAQQRVATGGVAPPARARARPGGARRSWSPPRRCPRSRSNSASTRAAVAGILHEAIDAACRVPSSHGRSMSIHSRGVSPRLMPRSNRSISGGISANSGSSASLSSSSRATSASCRSTTTPVRSAARCAPGAPPPSGGRPGASAGGAAFGGFAFSTPHDVDVNSPIRAR